MCFREATAATTAKRTIAKRAIAKGKGATVTIHEVEDKMQGNEA